MLQISNQQVLKYYKSASFDKSGWEITDLGVVLQGTDRNYSLK